MDNISEMPTIDEMIQNARRLKLAFRNVPTALVMTHSMCEQLRKLIPERASCDPPLSLGGVRGIYGLPIESYATADECLDRMLQQRDGERLQLVVSQDWPVRCLAKAYERDLESKEGELKIIWSIY